MLRTCKLVVFRWESFRIGSNKKIHFPTVAVISKQFLERVRLKREGVPSFDQYPFNLDAVRVFDALEMDPRVTFFVGENGSGKSTLLEAIAVKWGFNAEGGSENFRFETRRSHSELHEHLVLSRGIRRPKTGFFLRAESFFNVATQIEEYGVVDSYGGVSLHEQSHGESFLSLVLHRFGPSGFYILDEPEAALSPSRLLALIVRIKSLADQGCQFLIATHSPILMAFPGATIYSLGEYGVEEVDFTETDHWRLTERFIRDPDSVLDQLLKDSDDDVGDS
ncbi:MAG: putative ATPase [Verrucomicrobiales bacterium]